MDASAAVRTLVAHLFQRSGRAAMSENELVNAVSLDLKWYPPKDARALVASLAREGHLQRNEDGELEAGFPVKEVKVPLAFRPPPDLLYAMPPASDVAAQPPTTKAPATTARDPAMGGASQHSSPGHAAQQAQGSVRGDAGAGASSHVTSAGGHAAERNAPPGGAAASSDESEAPTEGLGAMLAAVAAAAGDEPGVWATRMNDMVQASADHLMPETALLLAAAESGLDVTPWLATARAALRD